MSYSVGMYKYEPTQVMDMTIYYRHGKKLADLLGLNHLTDLDNRSGFSTQVMFQEALKNLHGDRVTILAESGLKGAYKEMDELKQILSDLYIASLENPDCQWRFTT